MCQGVICGACVFEEFAKDLGVNNANLVKETYHDWRNSCPNEDVLALGPLIPMYNNLLPLDLQYYFLYTISLHFDPLTLYEWGFN